MVDIPKSVIDTLIAEAAGEGEEGMRRVAETILNRSAIRNLTPDQVVRQANQYTGWSAPGPAAVQAQNNAAVRALAEQAYRLALEPGDPTGGADHYFNPSIVQPRWANSMTPTGEYGGHAFYSSRPIPPGEIPNAVASALSVTPTPRVAPNPVTMSPDLSLMRNPLMSSSARNAQVTPMLPRPRPASPMDIARAPGQTIATIPTTARPGQSQIERNPTPQRFTLPTLPPSNIGRPPVTRTVQSVPYTLEPTAREIAAARGETIATIPTTSRAPTTAQINDAARRAALTANQSNVERNPAPRPVGSSTQNIAAQRAEQLSQRPPSSARLAPGPVGLTPNTAGVTLNQPPIQVVAPPQPARAAPIPMAASSRPLTPRVGSANNPVRVPPGMAITSAMLPQLQAAQQYGLPIMGSSPTRIVVNGAGSYSAPQRVTPVQSLMAQGMSNAQAYNALTAQRPTLEDRVRGSTGLSSSGASAYSISG